MSPDVLDKYEQRRMRNGEADFICLDPCRVIGGGEVHNFVGVQKGSAGVPDADQKTDSEQGTCPDSAILVER